jgi:hypothetical protein
MEQQQPRGPWTKYEKRHGKDEQEADGGRGGGGRMKEAMLKAI